MFKGCRNVEAGEKVTKSIRSCGIEGGEVSCFPLDVGSFKSIKKFAEVVLNHFPRIDLLINNGMCVLFVYSLISLLEKQQYAGYCLSIDTHFMHSLVAKIIDLLFSVFTCFIWNCS